MMRYFRPNRRRIREVLGGRSVNDYYQTKVKPLIKSQGIVISKNTFYSLCNDEGKTREEGIIQAAVQIFGEEILDIEAMPSPSPNPYFQLRADGRMEELEGELFADQDGKFGNRKAIFGLRGTGKTEIAIQLVEKWKKQYNRSHVFWANGNNLLHAYIAIARIVGDNIGIELHQEIDDRDLIQPGLTPLPSVDKDRIIYEVKRWMRSTSNQEPWFLVIDDCKDLKEVSEYLPDAGTHPRGSILVTSWYNRNFAPLGIIDPLEIESFTIEDAKTFLLRQTPGNIVKDEESAANIARALGCHPLALEHIRAYITHTFCTFEECLTRLDKTKTKLDLLTEYPDVKDESKSVATTWYLCFDEVKKAKNGDIAINLLKFCSFLYADFIPLLVFKDGVSMLGPELSDPLLRAEKDGDETFLKECFVPLMDFSLLRVLDENTRIMHSLVQDVLRSQMGREERGSWLERVVNTMALITPQRHYYYFNNAFNVLGQAEEYHYYSQELIRLYLHCVDVARDSSQLEIAMWLCLEANDINNEHSLVDSWDISIPLSDVLINTGALKEAIDLLQQALSANPPPLTKAEILSNIARSHIWADEYDQAQNHLIEAKSLFEKEVPTPTTIHEAGLCSEIYFHLASALNCQSREYEKAETYYLRAIEIGREFFPENIVALAVIESELGTLYAKINQYDKAEAIMKKALKEAEKHLSTLGYDIHPSLATHHFALSTLYSGYYKRSADLIERKALPRQPYPIPSFLKAKNHLNKSINILSDLYGEGHYRTLRSYTMLLDLYQECYIDRKFPSEFQTLCNKLERILEAKTELDGYCGAIYMHLSIFYMSMGNRYKEMKYHQKALDYGASKAIAQFF